MKKYIIYGLCVFTGVALAIGLSTTFAASPTVSPPGGNVTPTFSGLTVNDSATIKNLGVSNEFGVVGITTLIGDTKIIDGDLNVVKNLDVGGVLDIEGSINSIAQGVVLLDNNATVAKDLIVNEDLTVNGFSTLKEPLTVEGLTTLNSQVDVKGYLSSSDAEKDIDVGSKLNVWESIYNTTVDSKNQDESVLINDNLKVTGSTTVDVSLTTPKIVGGVVSTINGVSTPNLTVEGNLISTGSIHAIDYLSTDSWLQTDKYLAVGEYAQIDGNLRVGGKIKNDLTASTPVTFSDIDGVKIEATGVTGVTELDVKGDLKADTIGSYGEKSSGKIAVTTNSSNKADTPACDSKGVIVDCGMKNYRLVSGSYTEVDYDFTVHSIYADKSTNKCTVKAKNNSAAARYLEAIAVCFYPSY